MTQGGQVKYRSIIYLLGIIISFSVPVKGWSWLHEIKPSDYVFYTPINDAWQVAKTDIQPFSQLLFSWNALRSRGYFSFWVQVRDRITKKWYDWHQAAWWGTDSKGKKIQRSLQSKSKYGTRYLYVRLELPKSRLADAFRIKIRAHNGASIQDVKRIAVNTINLKKFNSEVPYNSLSVLPSVYIATVPLHSQMVLNHPRHNVLCSPTSTTMLLGYLLKRKLDPRDVAQGVYDHGLGIYGSWPFNVAHAFEMCGGRVSFHVERLSSFRDLHKHLTSGMPVVVSVRGPLKGAPLPYAQGHLLLVVGYNKRFKKVLCQDPAFNSNDKTAVAYDLKNFLTAWERSHRLAYVATRA
jgi:hypothetical protein